MQWPSPAAADAERASATYMRGNPTLLGAASHIWATPRAAVDKMGLTRKNARHDLQAQALSHFGLPDPSTTGGGSHLSSGRWPTPTSMDSVDSVDSGSRNLENSNAHPGTSLTDATVRCTPRPGGKLNPVFVGHLMGFPLFWAQPALMNSVGTEMGSFRFAPPTPSAASSAALFLDWQVRMRALLGHLLS